MALDPAFSRTYDRLAAAAAHHHDLRMSDASVPELAASRRRLDTLRLQTARLRRSTRRAS